MKKVTIYSTKTCVYCKMAKDFFANNKILFDEHDVGTDLQKRQEMIEKSGQMGVPVITVGDEVVVGFDKARLAEMLHVSQF